jgi:hypothetical protein
MSERLCAVGGSLELRPAGPPGFRLIAAVPAATAAATPATAPATAPAAVHQSADGAGPPAHEGATVTE